LGLRGIPIYRHEQFILVINKKWVEEAVENTVREKVVAR
jgi:hypothetical protein